MAPAARLGAGCALHLLLHHPASSKELLAQLRHGDSLVRQHAAQRLQELIAIGLGIVLAVDGHPRHIPTAKLRTLAVFPYRSDQLDPVLGVHAGLDFDHVKLSALSAVVRRHLNAVPVCSTFRHAGDVRHELGWLLQLVHGANHDHVSKALRLAVLADGHGVDGIGVPVLVPWADVILLYHVTVAKGQEPDVDQLTDFRVLESCSQ
mmetsp:Transcript_64524/g.140478  ORF Transcript_64524/g.140478 Transcript_64524/m.140478 type:complete len:206 (-) Transcript_64524:242-859(-)